VLSGDEVMYLGGLDRLLARVPNATTLREHLTASHTTTEEVGKVAAEAGAKTLVLNHFVPGDDPSIIDEMWVADVRKDFSGPVLPGAICSGLTDVRVPASGPLAAGLVGSTGRRPCAARNVQHAVFEDGWLIPRWCMRARLVPTRAPRRRIHGIVCLLLLLRCAERPAVGTFGHLIGRNLSNDLRTDQQREQDETTS
jgi:hypothetical protein